VRWHRLDSAQTKTMSDLEKYFKVTLCPGCPNCTKQLSNGQQIRQEHVLSQQDVTNEIKTYKIKFGGQPLDIQDITIKE
jgi:hypothetical protein